MYTVIFMGRKGAEKLGAFDDKGQCRRAWKDCTRGAAIVDAAGTVLEHRSGTTKEAERALGMLAAEMRARLARGEVVVTEPPRGRTKGEAEDKEVDPDDNALGMDAARDRAAAAEQWSAPAGPEDFRGEDYPAEWPQPIVPERVVTAPAPPSLVDSAVGRERLAHHVDEHHRYIDRAAAKAVAEVTHAVAPTTGAVVVGDDTERLTPPAAPVTCATKGCAHAPGIDRKNVRPGWRPFCGACRVVIRNRRRSIPGGEEAVIAHLRAGTLPPASAYHAALGSRGGKASVARAARKPAKPKRDPSPGPSLAAGLAKARAHAEVVTRLGGLAAAQELAELVEAHGGAAAVREALDAVAELGRVAA